MTVLVVVEQDQGTVVAASLEALTLARTLTSSAGSVEAAVFGSAPATGIGSDLAGYGVSRVHVLEHELIADYAPEAWGESLAQATSRIRPSVVLAAGTERGNETLAQAAARSRLPLAVNCVQVAGGPGRSGGSGTWTVTRLRAGGMLLEDAELTAPIAMVTLAPGAVTAVPAGGAGDVPVERFVPDLAGLGARSRIVDRVARGAGVTLAGARVVVSGGRGVGGAEGFAPLEELAGLLGGAVGCSRVATNNGWRPHSDQVGQTGTRVSPELYIACGISGATQHWVGCMGSKAILAINTDAEAPMVTRATYAVIGDVHEVLPAVINEVRSRVGAAVGR